MKNRLLDNNNKHDPDLQRKPYHKKGSHDVIMKAQLKTCYLFIGNYSDIRKFSVGYYYT